MLKQNFTTSVVFAFILLLFPASVLAQRISIESQLKQLKLKINQLQQDIHNNPATTNMDKQLESNNTFYRNLSRGDTGDDVRRLQELLNAHTGVQVSRYGPGSPGQETDYFGSKTHQAVIKFQNKYADEISATLGIATPFGYVDKQTREVLVKSSRGVVEDNNVDNTGNPDDNVSEETNSSEEITSDTDRQLTQKDDQPKDKDTELNQQSSRLSQSASADSISQNPQLMNLSSRIDFTKTSFTKAEKLKIVEQIPQPYRKQYYPDLADKLDSEKSTTTSSIIDTTRRVVSGFVDQVKTAFRFDVDGVDWFVPKAHAQGLANVFGGRIVKTIDCSCPGFPGSKIIVSPPESGVFYYNSAVSQAYREYNQDQSGVWTVGSYAGFGICLMKSGNSCTTLPPTVDGTILQIGTSN